MANYYPLTKFYFLVRITKQLGGSEEASIPTGPSEDNGTGITYAFQEVTGLEMTREKAEYRHGEDSGFVKRQIPGMKTYGELTLKKGTFTNQDELYKWWNGEGNPDGMPDRRNVTISLKNSANTIVYSWIIKNAWPTKFTATDLMAENNEIAVETLVLCHEGITQVSRS